MHWTVEQWRFAAWKGCAKYERWFKAYPRKPSSFEKSFLEWKCILGWFYAQLTVLVFGINRICALYFKLHIKLTILILHFSLRWKKEVMQKYALHFIRHGKAGSIHRNRRWKCPCSLRKLQCLIDIIQVRSPGIKAGLLLFSLPLWKPTESCYYD